MIRVWIGGDGWVDDDWMGWSLRVDLKQTTVGWKWRRDLDE